MLLKFTKGSHCFLTKLARRVPRQHEPLQFCFERPKVTLYQMAFRSFHSKEKRQPEEPQAKGPDTNGITPPLPTPEILSDTSSFRDRVEAGAVIVDKTDYLFQLIDRNSAFVMAPRRFGKSLNLSTVEAIFREGNDWWQDKCKNLAIVDKHNYDFPQHPVLRLDFSAIESVGELRTHISDSLERMIDAQRKSERIKDLKDLTDIQNAFMDYKSGKSDIIELFEDIITKVKLATGKGVVILVDEYDRPVTDVLGEILVNSGKDLPQDYSGIPEIKSIMDFLKKFFTKIKILRADGFVRFLYVTGIVPLTNVGMFSGANDIFQVRTSEFYGYLVGYTEDEIEQYFGGKIREFAEKLLRCRKERGYAKEQSLEEVVKEIQDKLRYNYNGFVFNPRQEKSLYSPFAINTFFDAGCMMILKPVIDIAYQPFFALSGSTKLIWRSVKRMSLLDKAKLALALTYDVSEITLFPEQSPADFSLNQPLDELFNKSERLGFFSGFLTIQKEKSSAARWNLGIVNNEMRQTLLQELENTAGLGNLHLRTLLSHLCVENYHEYFRLVNEYLMKMTAFLEPNLQTDKIDDKHYLEFEANGHSYFNLIQSSLVKYSKSSSEWVMDFVPNKKIVSGQGGTPDTVISFKTYKNKKSPEDSMNIGAIPDDELPDERVALIIEFKCHKDVKTALELAGEALKKYTDLENLKEEYKFLKDSRQIFIGAALGYGRIQALEFYKLDESGELKLSDKWPKDQ